MAVIKQIRKQLGHSADTSVAYYDRSELQNATAYTHKAKRQCFENNELHGTYTSPSRAFVPISTAYTPNQLVSELVNLSCRLLIMNSDLSHGSPASALTITVFQNGNCLINLHATP